MYLVMFLVACVDETRKKNYYRHELCSFSCRAIHISVDKGTLLLVTSRELYPLQPRPQDAFPSLWRWGGKRPWHRPANPSF